MQPLSPTQAARILRTVAQDWQAFRCVHGGTARNLRQLADLLDDMNEEEFAAHATGAANDFAAWAEIVLTDKRLASRLRLLSSLDATRRTVRRRVDELMLVLPPEPTVEQLAYEADIAFANMARTYRRSAAPAPTAASAQPQVQAQVVEAVGEPEPEPELAMANAYAQVAIPVEASNLETVSVPVKVTRSPAKRVTKRTAAKPAATTVAAAPAKKRVTRAPKPAPQPEPKRGFFARLFDL